MYVIFFAGKVNSARSFRAQVHVVDWATGINTSYSGWTFKSVILELFWPAIKCIIPAVHVVPCSIHHVARHYNLHALGESWLLLHKLCPPKMMDTIDTMH